MCSKSWHFIAKQTVYIIFEFLFSASLFNNRANMRNFYILFCLTLNLRNELRRTNGCSIDFCEHTQMACWFWCLHSASSSIAISINVGSKGVEVRNIFYTVVFIIQFNSSKLQLKPFN